MESYSVNSASKAGDRITQPKKAESTSCHYLIAETLTPRKEGLHLVPWATEETQQGLRVQYKQALLPS